MSAFDEICQLEARRLELYQLTAHDPYAPITAEADYIADQLERLWHLWRMERGGLTDETPETYQQDRNGLKSVTAKTDAATLRSRQTNATRAARRAEAAMIDDF